MSNHMYFSGVFAMTDVLANGALFGKKRYHISVLSVALLATTLGCGKTDSTRASVHGTVTVGGEPIENGQIVFRPTGGNSGPSAGATIENGHYSVAAKKGPMIGSNQIQINGREKTGKKIANYAFPGGPPLDEYREIVPKHYRGDESILIYEVVSGDQEKHFELDVK